MPLHRHFHDFYSPQIELLLCGELKETGVGMVDCQSKSQTTTQPSQLTSNAQLSKRIWQVLHWTISAWWYTLEHSRG